MASSLKRTFDMNLADNPSTRSFKHSMQSGARVSRFPLVTEGDPPYSMASRDPDLSVTSSCGGNLKPDMPRYTLITGVSDDSLMMPELIACCNKKQQVKQLVMTLVFVFDGCLRCSQLS